MTAKYLIPLLVFIGLAIFLGIGLKLDPKHLPSQLIGKPAPEFSLPLLDQANAEFSPSQMLGKKWILNVWASWCVSCRYEHPLLNELAENSSIPIVGLNYKDESNAAIAWLLERGNPYTAIPEDIEGSVGIDWGVYGVPETFVIDENGIVLYRHAGPIDATILQSKLLPYFN